MNFKKPNISRHLLVLLPAAGGVIFFLLYIVATLLYPGGSQHDMHTKGFSWTHNYWCNLLNETAINGMPNEARPIAIAAMIILLLALTWFWILFGAVMPVTKTQRALIQYAGPASMVTAFFIDTRLHDIVIDVAGLLGLIALVCTLAGLYKMQWMKLFLSGLFLIFLMAVNNLLYYGSGLIRYLPVVQKITFACVLCWVIGVNLELYSLSLKKARPC